MGKKLQGASLRAYKRTQLHRDATQACQAAAAEALPAEQAPDRDLFVLDTLGKKNDMTGGQSPSRQASGKGKGAANSAESSGNIKKKRKKNEHDYQAAVDRMRQTHDPATLQQLARQGRERLHRYPARRGLPQRGQTIIDPFDLWKEEEEGKEKNVNVVVQDDHGDGPNAETTTRSSSSIVCVEVAQPGQSYQPDRIAHQQQLRLAVHIEQYRQAAQREKETPFGSTGMSAETRKLLLVEEEEEEEEEYDEEDVSKDPLDERNEETVSNDETTVLRSSSSSKSMMPCRRDEKLTTAQRNKRKRLRAAHALLEQRKLQKRLLQQVNQVSQLKKELRQHEDAQKARRTMLQSQKEERTQRRIPGTGLDTLGLSTKDLINQSRSITMQQHHQNPHFQQQVLHVPTVPVALSCELSRPNASLRSMVPKGSLVMDRLRSMVDRQLVTQRNRQASKARKKRIKVQGAIQGPGFDIKG